MPKPYPNQINLPPATYEVGFLVNIYYNTNTPTATRGLEDMEIWKMVAQAVTDLSTIVQKSTTISI